MTTILSFFVRPPKEYYPKNKSLLEPLLSKISDLGMAKNTDIIKIEYPDGSEYRGNFSLGKPHGFGRLKDSQNKIILGTWNLGNLENKNVMITYPNQDTYFGYAENGLPHGMGEMKQYTAEGKVKIIKGFWENGEPKSLTD